MSAETTIYAFLRVCCLSKGQFNL